MGRLSDVVEALKLEHTVFALPFAYMGVWAMVGGRTAGMAANRLIDLPIDRQNPRTEGWAVPAGRVKPALLLALVLLDEPGDQGAGHPPLGRAGVR